MGQRLSWERYFINIAKETATKSKDPSSKVGCVIVDKDKRVVSSGFNGFVAGCDEHYMSQERPLKYHQVIHAEMNALIFSRKDVYGCKIYTTHGPCDNCLKHLLQAGIKEIYYDDPGIMLERGEYNQKLAIGLLVKSTKAIIINVNNNKNYVEEIGNIELFTELKEYD